MKTTYTAMAWLLAGCAAVMAQQFDPGSDGALGDFVSKPGVNTIALPPDGVLKYRTFTVLEEHVVVFAPNKANTPVWVLATGDITVRGLIDVSGSLPPKGRGAAACPGRVVFAAGTAGRTVNRAGPGWDRAEGKATSGRLTARTSRRTWLRAPPGIGSGLPAAPSKTAWRTVPRH